MTNAEKFKTAEERESAFTAYCNELMCGQPDHICTISTWRCALRWLDMEAEEEKPLPCMCCGGRMEIHGQALACTKCGLRISYGLTTYDVTNVYNRFARVMAGRNEVK